MEYQGGARTIDLQPPGPKRGESISCGPGPRRQDTSQGPLGVISHGWLQPGRPGLGEVVMGG